jgi:hypothetical protein
VMDYTTYLRGVASLPQNPPLMLEHLASAGEYDAARLHILETGKRAGIGFS